MLLGQFPSPIPDVARLKPEGVAVNGWAAALRRRRSLRRHGHVPHAGESGLMVQDFSNATIRLPAFRRTQFNCVM
jgi:hypothetical protein